jgi:hypothetical protein
MTGVSVCSSHFLAFWVTILLMVSTMSSVLSVAGECSGSVSSESSVAKRKGNVGAEMVANCEVRMETVHQTKERNSQGFALISKRIADLGETRRRVASENAS